MQKYCNRFGDQVCDQFPSKTICPQPTETRPQRDARLRRFLSVFALRDALRRTSAARLKDLQEAPSFADHLQLWIKCFSNHLISMSALELRTSSIGLEHCVIVPRIGDLEPSAEDFEDAAEPLLAISHDALDVVLGDSCLQAI